MIKMILTSSQKKILLGSLGVMGIIGVACVLLSFKAKAEKECEEGETESVVCDDSHSSDYGETFITKKCINGIWVEYSIPKSWCTPKPICEEGTSQCISPHTLLECVNGNWNYIENSLECGYKPPCNISIVFSANYHYPTFFVIDNNTDLPIQGAKISLSTMVGYQFVDIELITNINGIATYEETGRMLDAIISANGYIPCIYETYIGNLPKCGGGMCPRFTIKLDVKQ